MVASKQNGRRDRRSPRPPAGGSNGRLSIGTLVDKLSARADAAAYAGTLAANTPGVRYVERTAAERYEVLPSFRRFTQKFNMTRQGIWEPEAVAATADRGINRNKLVQAGKPGYSLLDWGFNNAADANQRLTSFGINSPNQGPTSWQPLGPLPPAGLKWSAEPATNARAIKKIARIFGAGDVGITLLDRRWVYAEWFDEKTKQSYPIKFSDEPGYEHLTEPTQLEDGTQVIPASMKYVAVFVLPMPRHGVRAAPTLTQFAATQVTYSEISRLIASVAEFIRGLGYHAIPSSNCTALNIPLAIDAGLGELGRNAKLIHPVWGPIIRTCKVITDLPMEPDIPIATGATAFCESCKKCAQTCPVRAVPDGPRSYEPLGNFSNTGVKQWMLNHRKCYDFWGKVGSNCGLCLVTCPFNKGTHWSHDLARAAIARFPAIHPLIVDLDDAFGYGRNYPDGLFWSDVETDD